MQKTKRTVKQAASTGRLAPRKVALVVRAIHVAPTEGGWVVHKAGPKRIRKILPSRDEALTYARKIGLKVPSEIVLHARDGKIRRVVAQKTSLTPPRSAVRR